MRLARFGVMLPAKRDDVPATVRGIALLHMSPYRRALIASYLRACGRQKLATEVLPMVQPAAAFADVADGAVDILHEHGHSISQ